MSGENSSDLTTEWLAESEAGEVPVVTAEMIVRPAGDEVVETGPPSLAHATGPALRPWRGVTIAGGLHLVIAAAILALVKIHLPLPHQEAPAISVIVETTPQGNTTADVRQPDPVLPPPAPVAPVQPVPSTPAAQPVSALAYAKADISEQVVKSTPPPPAYARLVQKPPALVKGTTAPGHKIGVQVVQATRPAIADAGNSAPIYTLFQRQLGEQGVVRLRVVILPSGAVGKVILAQSSGFRDLDAAALDAVQTWHFQPKLENGVPVPSMLPYFFDFELR